MSNDLDEKLRDLKQKFQDVLVDDISAFRKVARDCLEPRFLETHSSDPDSKQGIWSPGLYWVARNYQTALQEPQSGVLGYSDLEIELDNLKSAFDILASRLKNVTPQAATWIQYPETSGDPRNERIRVLSVLGDIDQELSIQARGEKSPMVKRLEALAELMGILSNQVVEAKKKAPPGKQYIPERIDSPDFRLFLGCGKQLLVRGYRLEYLRPIAEAIYWWVHGTNPSDFWGIRAERYARAALRRVSGRVIKKGTTKR